MGSPLPQDLRRLNEEIIACERCPRLRAWCEKVAREKRAAFADWDYWGRPVPGWGDPQARVLIVGLAPAAHGGNRTGRVFTGDRSGDFLYAALHRTGMANQPTSVSRDDGLELRGVYVTAANRCAPPDNKPTLQEQDNCREYLERELELLSELRVVITLGKIAHDNVLKALRSRGELAPRRSLKFGHGLVHPLEGRLRALLCSYHVSQQNTFTGRLTPGMFDEVLRTAQARAR